MGLHSWCKACYEANASQKAKRQRWKTKVRKSAVEQSANSVKQGEVCQA
ncbi:hypothetical protein [Testudinibacter aquarius]|nr:hypothetical protein [Testudinibacter aquarius]